MLVKSILVAKGSDVYSIPPHLTVLEAVAVLREKRVGAVLVLDSGQNILGVFSERDLVRAIADHGVGILEQPVSTLMSRAVVCCGPADSIDHVMSLMTDRRIRHVPVVENGRLVGIISIGDVVKNRIAETEMEAEALKSYIAAG